MRKNKNETYDGSTPLKSVMQESFVQNIMLGLPQYEAYRQAYKKDNNCSELALASNSSRVITYDNVIARLNFLKRKTELKSSITIERCRQKYLDIMEKCEKRGAASDMAVAKSCCDSLMKSIGGFQRDRIPDADI